MSDQPFVDRLEQARVERHTVLCVGLDPRLERIPEALHQAAGGDTQAVLEGFGRTVLRAAGPHAACVKPQVAFFECHGLPGLRAYATLVGEARAAGIPVLGDVKRGDIGSTAAAYAQAHLAPGADFEVDAITINPYLGDDSLAPFIEAAAEHGKGLYILVRTSNPGAADFQERTLEDARLFERVADHVARLGSAHRSDATGLSCVGAVVGATSPEALAALRARMPDVPFLVPGYGAQGATAADVRAGYRPDGSGAVVNASRSINFPADTASATADAYEMAVAQAAVAAKEDLYGALVN